MCPSQDSRTDHSFMALEPGAHNASAQTKRPARRSVRNVGQFAQQLRLLARRRPPRHNSAPNKSLARRREHPPQGLNRQLKSSKPENCANVRAFLSAFASKLCAVFDDRGRICKSSQRNESAAAAAEKSLHFGKFALIGGSNEQIDHENFFAFFALKLLDLKRSQLSLFFAL